MPKWTPIDVNGEHPYQVIIGENACSLLTSMVGDCERVAIIYPPTLAPVLPELASTLTSKISYLPVPDGEAAKTPEVLAQCWNALATEGFTRSDVIVGFGGGSTTDLAGFISATWLRGVRYISVPTTVLAMVDAAVGGKTGINLSQGKNLVGAFYNPYCVLGDVKWLQTLSARDISSGFAEALKAGFISDPAILDDFEADQSLLKHPDERLAEVIQKAVRFKAKVVEKDFREQTLAAKVVGVDAIGRECLNYGHTMAHAIEVQEGFSLRHGEAVSIGMVFAAEVALRLRLIDAELVDRHRRVLGLAGLPISYQGSSYDRIRESMRLDKKTRGDHLRLVLLTELAHPTIFFDPDEAVLKEAFKAIQGE